ncbi:hypothetical protein PIROE2DRAFT_1339 [Piromyces sp. E2]|nr:hypothetical protein PIROE2DRAFT_1339 [Piromyces sp. E2]|eukprot:OUM70475.1 hypothetical protein PIROE2DRAFT_1339 [Piromyces sp. E2]
MQPIETLLFEEKDVVNREFYRGIKNMIKCSVCLNIAQNPVQCDKCQQCFCSQCVKDLSHCPFNCGSHQFIPSLMCQQLLSKLIIRCECGRDKKYDLLNKELDKNNKITNEYTIKSKLHKHPVQCIRRFLQTWTCDNCKNRFYDDTPTYHCTLCDYDICYECAKNSITEGTLKTEMIQYYQSKPEILTQYSTISQLHHHPIEYNCDSCHNKFTDDIPSFRCTLCDFDLCYDYAERTSVQQNNNVQPSNNTQQIPNVQQFPNVQPNPNIQQNNNNANAQQNSNANPLKKKNIVNR